jgi:DNA-binding transcriptional regulator/RsmH inhibitor MraZ
VDEKGRMKLPAAIHKYFVEDLKETRIFCTTLDGRIARLYPLSVWKVNEELFLREQQDVDDAEDVWFLSQELGDHTEVDSQQRVLIPAELRRETKIEGQNVYLEHYKGRINVFNEDVYQERRQRARENAREKLRKFEMKGLK